MSFVTKLKACVYTSAFSLLAASGLNADGGNNQSPEYMPNFVRVNTKYSQEVTNPYMNTGNKYLAVMKNRKSAGLMDQSLYVGMFGQASAEFVSSNIAGTGYWSKDMRGKKNASDVQLNEAYVGFSGTVTPWATVYAETMLYSDFFASNGVSLSQAFAVIGDMDQYPVYLAAGLSYVPFGHFDSLSGINKSMLSWFFQSVNQNVTLGYSDSGFNVTASALRNPTTNSNLNSFSLRSTESEIEAFAASASYNDSYANGDWYVGVSWMNQSQFDFTYSGSDAVYTDTKRNSAWDVNGGITYNDFSVRGEYVATNKKWPATTHKVESFEVEASYDFNFMEYDNRFTIGWAEMKWATGDVAKTFFGSSDQKKTDNWHASWVTSMHENLSAFLAWDHYKGPLAGPSWGSSLSGTAPVQKASLSKALKTDIISLGMQFAF